MYLLKDPFCSTIQARLAYCIQATLTTLGQITAIWVGGGTLISWAVIPAAAICGVSSFELVRRNMKPAVIGLVVTTIVAIFLL